ncbi:hypothetical protein B0J11DRAFT_543203 [Dendryphion nanum]|uniref:Uncharacterized protein n=1 Tax=Dendryphion nanum TaxID=256645 RepID=A0A9P9I9I3_9PLEO|nr:hypothetical protein B0J11DRAFT_543203 [Dendryphion nanum]
MSSQSRLEIIQSKPIGNRLKGWRDSFNTACENYNIPASLQALNRLDHEVVQNCTLPFTEADLVAT